METELSVSELSEIADKKLEDYVKGLYKSCKLTTAEFDILFGMVIKASRLAFEAGIEHEQCNHSCPPRCGSAFG